MFSIFAFMHTITISKYLCNRFYRTNVGNLVFKYPQIMQRKDVMELDQVQQKHTLVTSSSLSLARRTSSKSCRERASSAMTFLCCADFKPIQLLKKIIKLMWYIFIHTILLESKHIRPMRTLEAEQGCCDYLL